MMRIVSEVKTCERPEICPIRNQTGFLRLPTNDVKLVVLPEVLVSVVIEHERPDCTYHNTNGQLA